MIGNNALKRKIEQIGQSSYQSQLQMSSASNFDQGADKNQIKNVAWFSDSRKMGTKE
jgi:hypothetical protein